MPKFDTPGSMPATRMPETIFFAVTKGAKKKHFNIWAQTQMAHSAETEVALFQNIANPEKTSTSPRPADGALEEQPDDDFEDGSQFSSMFDEAVNDSQFPGQNYNAMPPAATESTVMDDQIPEAAPSPPAFGGASQAFDYTPEPPAFGQVGPDEDVEMEKQAVLMELDHLKSQGITLSKAFSMVDTLESMQFEVRRHLSHLDETRMVGILNDMFKMALTGLEMGSKKFNFLDMDGYSAEVTSDMSRFTPALTRLYRKYYRKSVWSPEAEIGFALCSSVAMFHFRKKFYSGAPPQAGGGGASPFNFANMAGMAAGMGGPPAPPAPAAAPAPRPPGGNFNEAPPPFM